MTTSIEDETEYGVTRGDADDLLVTVVDASDPAVPYDLTLAVDGTENRPAVIRFAVKKRVTDTNENALIVKKSYLATEIELLPQSDPDTVGQVVVYIDVPDTVGQRTGSYYWDFEVTRQGRLRAGASAGTLSLVADSNVVTGVGTDFTKAKVGDVLQTVAGLNIGVPVLITRIVSATSIEIDTDSFAAESGIAFEVRRGFRRTPLRGPFTLGAEVIH